MRAQYRMVKIKETGAWNLTAECVGKAVSSTQWARRKELYSLGALCGENPKRIQATRRHYRIFDHATH